MGGFYILIGSILEKCGKFWKNGRFSGRIWPDWGNASRADLAGLVSPTIPIAHSLKGPWTLSSLMSESLDHIYEYCRCGTYHLTNRLIMLSFMIVMI